MESVAGRIAGWLVSRRIVESEYYAVFQYAAHCLLSTLQLIVITLSIGILSGKTAECICLVLPIALLRKYGGGYHCKHEMTCTIASTCTIAAGLFLFTMPGMENIILPWNVVAALSLFVLSPVGTIERPIKQEERREFKGKTITTLAGFETLAVIFLHCKWTSIATSMIGGIIIASLIQLAGFLVQRRGKDSFFELRL